MEGGPLVGNEGCQRETLGRYKADNGHRPVTEENPAEGRMTRGRQAGRLVQIGG